MKGENAMYTITVNEGKKAFVVETRGFFGEEEGKNFLKEYQEKVGSINPKRYSFIICGKDLKTSSQDMIDILNNCLKMYKDSGFKDYYTTKPVSAVSWMQLQKLLKENRLDMTIGESVDDILGSL